MLSTASSPQAECFISMGLLWVQSLTHLESSELVLGLPWLDRQVSMGMLQGGQGRPLERLSLAAQTFGATEAWH